MKKFKFAIGGSDFNVEVVKVEGNMVEVEVNGSTYEVEMKQEVKTTKTPIIVRQEVAPTDKEKKIAKSPSKTTNTAVKSPLPGIIIQVFVKEGDTITMGQKLMTMEAMKMENNILAEMAGTIASIKVKAGDSVLQNDVLVELQ